MRLHDMSRHRRQKGFSIVEIMVGMLIGLFAMLVILEVMSMAETRRRSTTSGDDAVSNGAAAFYALKRDLMRAGYDISDSKLLSCSLLLGTAASGVAVSVPLAPVTVNPLALAGLGDTNTDTFLVIYGNGNGTPQGDGIVSAASPIYSMQTARSFNTGDWVVATSRTASAANSSTACGVTLTLDWVANVGAATITVNTGGVAGLGNGSTVFNLGRRGDLNSGNRFTVRAYAVRSGALEMCDYIDYSGLAAGGAPVIIDCTQPANWSVVAKNIVSMRMLYGRDDVAGAGGTPVQAADPTYTGGVTPQNAVYMVNAWDQTTPTTACGWMRALSVRMALVARATQQAGTTATTVAPTWSGSGVAAINLAGLTNWQSYRYKTFETVVPLRNVAWMGWKAGC